MCGRAMKKNGRTGKGVQRWKCPACRLSSTMPQRRRRRERTLEEFLSWLLGPSSQRAADPAGDARALRKRIAWCWRIRPRIAPPDARRHTVMADGTYMGHGWCLIIAIDGQTGEVLDRRWCAHESKAAYLALFSRLPAPDVLITDGLRGAEAACTQAWPGTRIQRCLVHVRRNARTDLTSRPGLQAGREQEAVRRARLGRDGRAGRQVGRGPQRMARTVEGLHRRTHLRARRPVQPQGVEAPVVVDARGAATLLPAAGEAVPRGQAVRLSRAGTAEGRSGGAHHEPAGGRRQLGRQGRIAQPSRAARGAHAPRVRMGMLHEDRAPTTGVIHPRRPAEGRKGNDARTGRQRRARIRDRHRLERIPHHHAIPQHHRLTTKTSLKHHKSSYRPVFRTPHSASQ